MTRVPAITARANDKPTQKNVILFLACIQQKSLTSGQEVAGKSGAVWQQWRLLPDSRSERVAIQKEGSFRGKGRDDGLPCMSCLTETQGQLLTRQRQKGTRLAESERLGGGGRTANRRDSTGLTPGARSARARSGSVAVKDCLRPCVSRISRTPLSFHNWCRIRIHLF